MQTAQQALCFSNSRILPTIRLLSGPLGGDQQTGALIATEKLTLLVFFWDPLTSQPHDPDVNALLWLAVVWDIPMNLQHGNS